MMTILAANPGTRAKHIMAATVLVAACVAPGALLLGSAQALAQAPNTSPQIFDETVRRPASPPMVDETARRRAEQEAPQKLVPFNPTHFDKYVGYYQLGPRVVAQVYRDGGKFFSQLTGQGPVEFYPESETKFFATVVAAQISFVVNAQGDVTGMTLHQNGLELPARRIDESTAKSMEEALADRIRSGKPSPGTEAFLRRYIASQEAGKPDYSEMAPPLEALARKQQERFTKDVAAWGPLVSIEFSRVDPRGSDIYMVTFKNARVPTLVTPIGSDGKVAGLGFGRPQ